MTRTDANHPPERRAALIQRWLFYAAVVALMADGGSVLAQNIGGATGQIRGRVADASGAILPGATVTATSPALPGPAEATTDERGEFRFPALPFGTYRVQAALSGYVSSALEGLQLNIGETLRANLSLTPGFEETVDVRAAGAVIDVVTSSNAHEISSEVITDLPQDRTFDTLALIVPAVNSETQLGTGGSGTPALNANRAISIQGASVVENVFIVDGVETGDTTQGLSAQDIVSEFVEQIQVKSGGFSAEYGGALGGLINVSTKSGSNVFTGGLTFQYTGDSISEGPRPELQLTPDNTSYRYVPVDADKFDQYDVGIYVGGPIVRDRLWFFGGFVPQYKYTKRDYEFTMGGSEVFTEDTKRQFASVKLTYRPVDSLTLNGSYNHSPWSIEGELPAVGTLPSAPEYDYGSMLERNNAKSATFTFDWTPSDRLLVSGFGGLYYLDGAEAVANATRVTFMQGNYVFPDIPTDLQGPYGYSNVPNNLGEVPRKQRRPSFGVSASTFFKGAGDHSLKVGLQYSSPYTLLNRRYVGGRFFMHWDQSDAGVRGPYGFYREFIVKVEGEVDSSNVALFAQDSWQVTDRLTLDLGIRAEREAMDTPLSEEAPIQFGFADKLAPRFGFAYDVKGNGSWKLYGTTGLFYDVLKHNVARAALAGTTYMQNYYTLDSYDWTQLSEDNPGALGSLIRSLVVLTPVEAPVDPDLKPTRTFEIAGGTEVALSEDLAVGARYTYKTLQDMINFSHVDPTGLTAGVSTIVNPGQGLAEFPYGSGYPAHPGLTRRYNGLELTLNRRLANNWMGSLSYIFSRLRGITDGLASADAAGGDLLPNSSDHCAFLEGCFDDSGAVDDGPLSLDRPHQFKAYGAYRFPWGLTVGGFFRAVSGVPYEPQGEVVTAPGVRVRFFHIGGRGASGRTPMLTQTDLFMEYAMKLGGNKRLALFANVQNLFDQDTATMYFKALYRGSVSVPRAQFFQGFDYAAVAASQGQGLDPRFGQTYVFQSPRWIRLGLRFTF